MYIDKNTSPLYWLGSVLIVPWFQEPVT